MRKDTDIKIKTCAVMQYFEYYDVQEIAVIETRIKNLTNIKTYCIIIHDKDLLDNGEPKKRHFHAVLTFSDTTTIGAVAKGLKVEPQYVEKIKTTTITAQLYLVHRNDVDKFQYDPSAVVANFDYMEKIDGYEPKQRKESIAKRIETGEIKQYNLFDYISINEYAVNHRYYENCFKYKQQKMLTTNRQMECVFITGSAGAGKTTFAKNLAEKYGYHYYVSSQGKNALDDYKDQECIILDDLRENVFNLSDFLKLTDNNTNSLINCRFFNKSITECKLLIVTTTKTLKDFYDSSLNNSNGEDIVQIERRFKTYIVVGEKDINIFNYNDDEKRYVWSTKITNPIMQDKLNNKPNQIIDDIRTKFGYDVVDFSEEEKSETVAYLTSNNPDNHNISKERNLFPV